MAEGAARTKDAPDLRSRLAAPVGAVITLIWAASALDGLYSGNFTGIEVVSPVMVIFAGYVFGINIVRTGEKAGVAPPPADVGAPGTKRGRAGRR